MLFICRAGCAQADVLRALRTRELWPDERPRSQSSSHAAGGPTFRELIAASAYLQPPACCLNREIKCDHWQEFDREYLVAVLRGNLVIAVDEITAAREPLGVEELWEELHAAVGFGAIAPSELPRSVVDRVIAEVALLQQATMKTGKDMP